MSVEKRGNKFRVTYSWQGKAMHETFTSETSAYARDDEIKAGKRVGTFIPPHELLNAEANPLEYGKGITVSEMMNILLLDYAPRNWKPNVLRTNRTRVNEYIIPLIGNEKLCNLTTKRVERFFSELKEYPQYGCPDKCVSTSVIEKIKVLLSTAMKEAYRLGYITTREQVDVVSLAQCDSYHSNEKIIWTMEEYCRAESAIKSPQMQILLKLSAFTAARIGELLGLKWNDVTFLENGLAAITFRWQLQRISQEDKEDNKKVVIYEELPGGWTTKGKKPPKTLLCLCGMKSKGKNPPPPRKIYVGPELASDLRKLKFWQEQLKSVMGVRYNDMGFVVAQNNGRPYEEHTIRNYLNQLCIENSLTRITPHAMRHWAISYLFMKCRNPKAVQDRTGQKSIPMIEDRYTHMFEDERMEIALETERSFAELRNSQNIPKTQMPEIPQ